MKVVDTEIGAAHFGECARQIMDVADFPVFGVFGFPAVAGTGKCACSVGKAVCAFKDAGKTQGFGVAQVGAGMVGKVYRGGKGGSPAAVALFLGAAAFGFCHWGFIAVAVAQTIFVDCFRTVRIIRVISGVACFFR